MAQPVSAEIEGVGHAYARLYGFLDQDNLWSEPRAPPIKKGNTFEVFITRLPFAIGERPRRKSCTDR
jgi:hypothetical protein